MSDHVQITAAALKRVSRALQSVQLRSSVQRVGLLASVRWKSKTRLSVPSPQCSRTHLTQRSHSTRTQMSKAKARTWGKLGEDETSFSYFQAIFLLRSIFPGSKCWLHRDQMTSLTGSTAQTLHGTVDPEDRDSRWRIVLISPAHPRVRQFLANFRQNVARFRLYRRRFLQVNTRFTAFFKIYQIIKLKFLKFGKILQI